MRAAPYPFAAIVGQEPMRFALLLAAVDWRLGVLLRGDKGSAKTTSARALAALLPVPAPFVNLPLGVSEDRLLGGLDLERALRGEAALKPGLLQAAHGGVLYIDEVNLLPAHLGDALLDAAASGVNTVERDGFSASHAAEFVLLGSMNPEEGTLRPQLLDRFALSVDVSAPVAPVERTAVMERRLAYERDAAGFAETWSGEQERLQAQIISARGLAAEVVCSAEMLALIAEAVCSHGVRSLRADLAMVRAAIASAALAGETRVSEEHVAAVLPLVLAHRTRRQEPPRTPPPQTPQAPAPQESVDETSEAGSVMERIFAPLPASAPVVRFSPSQGEKSGATGTMLPGERGAAVRARRSEAPAELDVPATVKHALRVTGSAQPRTEDLHERLRAPHGGRRFVIVIDSSGSHAARERMRVVKGATAELLSRSFRRGDEVALILFRGTAAQVLLEPTTTLADALAALEYLPTGGRTPLAHALELARDYVAGSTLLVLVTDGHANVSAHDGDPWAEALAAARGLQCAALVIDSESGGLGTGQTRELAEAMQARYVMLDELGSVDVSVELVAPMNVTR